MNIERYNELCKEWAKDNRNMSLGHWLMHHIPESDPEVSRKKDKAEGAALFFNRYVITSPNGVAHTLHTSPFTSHQPY